jgi:hypothetical protein
VPFVSTCVRADSGGAYVDESGRRMATPRWCSMKKQPGRSIDLFSFVVPCGGVTSAGQRTLGEYSYAISFRAGLLALCVWPQPSYPLFGAWPDGPSVPPGLCLGRGKRRGTLRCIMCAQPILSKATDVAMSAALRHGRER